MEIAVFQYTGLPLTALLNSGPANQYMIACDEKSQRIRWLAKYNFECQ